MSNQQNKNQQSQKGTNKQTSSNLMPQAAQPTNQKGQQPPKKGQGSDFLGDETQADTEQENDQNEADVSDR